MSYSNKDGVSIKECFTCKCQNFLPIKCRTCNNEFCEEHYRNHSCDISSSSSPYPSSTTASSSSSSSIKVQDMFNNVSTRFDNDNDTNSKNHYNIKTSNTNTNTNTKTANTLAKLEKVTGKEKNLANTTRNILLKKNAKVGYTNINDDDKWYLVIRNDDDIEDCYYFKKTNTIGDALNYLCNHYSNIFLKQPVRQSNICLRAMLMDDDNGNELDELLDRNLIISSLPLMSRIKCIPITTNDALNDQLIFNINSNDNECHQDKKVKVEEKEENNAVFTIGQDVLYSKNDITDVVKVISVHKDDFPNLYYTIKFDNGSEKQTIPKYLTVLNQNNINLQAHEDDDDYNNEKFSINVTHGKNNYILRVKDSSTINQVKNYIFNYTGVPISKQKIIFKGKTLSNDLTIINANITPNSKLMVMGSK